MELKTGMYVRTKKYGIAKIIGGTNYNRFNIDIFKKDGMTLRTQSEKDILKSSYNIIDLIEEGDYVNGNKVIYVEDLDSLEYLFVNADGESYYSSIYKDCNKPKTIVTKEQFKNMEYKVGGNNE